MIAITGGKGGTGKSTVATALAVELAKKGNVLLMDMDVDCPNDHLILSMKTKKVKDVRTMVPVFDNEKCTKCGRCREVCMENAIVQVKDRYPFVVADQCTGCRACQLACPAGAIGEKDQSIGEVRFGRGRVDLVTGMIRPGVEESSLVVNGAKKYAKGIERNYDYIVIDTAAGTHCPVIAALLGVKQGIAVTEPTPLGNHDLGLILELMKKLGMKSSVIINRSDIADDKSTLDVVKKHGSNVAGRIPYSRKIARDYAAGKPLCHETIKKIAEGLS